MNNFLLYIIKSTLCVSVLYIIFRMLMSKETCFSLNRWILLLIIFVSILIPRVYISKLYVPVQVELIPEFTTNHIQLEGRSVVDYSNTTQDSVQSANSETGQSIALISIIIYIYFTGLLIAFIALIKNIFSILLLRRRSTVIKMDGFKVIISERDIHSFAFANMIIISKRDFDTNGVPILSHEKAHIRLKHFYDLIFLEFVKAFHWFNPAIYGVIRSIKEIHEFQADAKVLHSGINASNYQLLLIEKCVGPKRFALANSFNHCQIKNRITMMNKQKTQRAWRWKVATFLPLLTILLMAFGKESKHDSVILALNEVTSTQAEETQLTQNQKVLTDRIIVLKSDGDYVNDKKCSLEEIVRIGKEWQKASNMWILIVIEKSLPYDRTDNIMNALSDAEVYHICLSEMGSDEIVYFAGDVNSLASFKDGRLKDWLRKERDKNLNKEFDSVEFHITYFFIVDKTGKVRDGHIVKPCEYPEINTAINKALSQMPDWNPAIRGGKPASVYWRIGSSQRVVHSTQVFE